MTEPKLKPCPFCGGEANTWEDFYDGWRLYCTKCDATFRGGSEEELVERWNKRVGEHEECCCELVNKRDGESDTE